jgi:hypothetical protein
VSQPFAGHWREKAPSVPATLCPVRPRCTRSILDGEMMGVYFVCGVAVVMGVHPNSGYTGAKHDIVQPAKQLGATAGGSPIRS